MGYKTQRFTRKTHRYLGVFIGIQLLFWTIGGIYFSWNDMDDVHGETLIDKTEHSFAFTINESSRKALLSIEDINQKPIVSIEGIVVNADSLLRIKRKNDVVLANLSKKQPHIQKGLSKDDCVNFVKSRLYQNIPIKEVKLLTEINITKSHEYRGNPLPAYAITLDELENTTVYVNPQLGKIIKVRNDNWRKFDFLWMLHVMDFETRDHITNWTLRVFSILSILTILSGFYLFIISSPTLRKLLKKYQK